MEYLSKLDPKYAKIWLVQKLAQLKFKYQKPLLMDTGSRGNITRFISVKCSSFTARFMCISPDPIKHVLLTG